MKYQKALGDPATKSGKYFTLLKTRVLEAIEAGITADEISKVVTMDDFKDVAMFDELNSRNVFDAFRELEFYDEE